jgi:hypothetical protein
VCNGGGVTDIAYQGCPCSSDGGDLPDGNGLAVCPEDIGNSTQSCTADACGGDTVYNGLCSSRTDLGGGYYRFCSCCPEDVLGCNVCGGDNGQGRCKGVEQYPGYQYLNCSCTNDEEYVGSAFHHCHPVACFLNL